MASVILDTQSFVKRLTAAGMPEQQAETLADEQFRLLHEQIATKGDIAAVRRDIDAFRTEIRGEVESMQREIEAVRGETDAFRTEIRGEVASVRGEIEAVRVALRGDMAAMERRLRDQLTVRFGGMLAGAVVLMGALVKLL